MIKNEKEYNYSKECAKKFEYSISVIQQDEAWRQNNPESWQSDIDVKKSHLMALQKEISEYETLINCENKQSIRIKVENFNKLPDTLVKARIAAKMSYKELADIIGFEEEKIKEYEAKNYRFASFSEILEISTALGIEFDDAFVKVDFDEIEEVKKIAEQWRRRKKGKELQPK
ncbi:hypothetical protein RIVM261_016210 [Rivularia sp. IAM M-261]|nr:hypothetical protein CAL7716_031370 [Calothrix sp. PCC 7716]GJD16665.1 hypothetical protein RIVM261_016210 [Rivularia sp. IAM M-261]